MNNANRVHEVHGGNPFTVYEGYYAFTTTGLTKDVSIPLSRIDTIRVQPIGAPGTAYRSASRYLGAVTATTSYPIITPPYAGALIAARLTVDTTHATHASNHWTFTLVNKGAAGSGTTDMLLADSTNSTDADSTPAGSAITAFVARSLTLHGTAANLVTAASDVLAFTATKAASAVSLAGATLELTWAFGDPGEALTINSTVSGTVGGADASIRGTVGAGATTVTVQRNAVNPTSGLKFSLYATGT